MDEIKIINKKIRSVICELLFTILIFVLALNVWLNPNTTIASFASSNDNQTVLLNEIEPLKLENIYPIDDEIAIENNQRGVFKIINKSNNNSIYSIVYRIYNTSTLDYNYLKYLLNIDGKTHIEFLSNVQITNNENYTDLTLYNGEIDKNNEKTFEYTMWLDRNVGNEAQNKSLSAQFVIKSYGNELSLR